MSDDEDYNSEDDQDYVPSDGEAVSEEEHSGDEEDLNLLREDAGDESLDKKGKRIRGKNKQGIAQRKRKGGIKLEGEEATESKEENEEEKARKKELEEEIAKEIETKKEDQDKKRANDLWSSFLSDVGSRPKPKPANSSSSLASLSQPVNTVSTKPEVTSFSKPGDKITVTKVFDFAGEEVKITKEVDVTSKEGQKEIQKKNENEDSGKDSSQDSETPKTSSSSPAFSVGVKRPAVGGGLGSVLSKINKKQKISTLDKSKLDWESFKTKEGISDELALHNKGKTSYIERQNFLNRADYRQFEIEKNLRLSNSKR